MNILLIDDDTTILRYYSMVLINAGYKVDAYEDPFDAVQSFKDNKQDIVVTDYHMPGMTGIKVKSEIKYVNYNTPVILLSGRQDMLNGLINKNVPEQSILEEKEYYMKRLNFDEYVNKLWKNSYQELLNAIKKVKVGLE